MTKSVMPARTKFSICHTMSGLPPTVSKGLGVESVSGRMRSPRPAARIMAFISESVARLLLAAMQLIQQLQQGPQRAIAIAGTA